MLLGSFIGSHLVVLKELNQLKGNGDHLIEMVRSMGQVEGSGNQLEHLDEMVRRMGLVDVKW